jgi:phenylalanyl-tRNA synthetase beta chain
MKILKSWLKDYIDFDLSDEEIGEKLSLSGTAIEDIDKTLDDLVVVAEIRKVEQHPNADRLRVATVWNGSEELQIVCGAPNIAEGQIVPLAQIGAKLGPDFEIKKAALRGVESFGMLCAADELGLGDDHEGIMILDDTCEIGTPLSKYIASDSVFDIEITPNRGDELSHIGVARELKALLETEVKNPKEDLSVSDSLPMLSVNVINSELCPQYFALKIDNVKVAESPSWLKERLEKCGVRSINNIVDVTNYIMLDLGQPMHAFDAKKVKGSIVVRTARENEDIVTLDGKVQALNEDMLVISDEKDAIAVAGVMGGANSEVDETTTAIILEAAEFERRSIRKTAKVLNSATDASYRFERGINSEGLSDAILKATKIILDIAGGEIASQVTKVAVSKEKTKVAFEVEKINGLTGLDLDRPAMAKILENLGFAIEESEVIVPAWRHDISIWQDLAEEVARIYGYNNIPAQDIAVTEAPSEKSDYYYKENLKDILVAEGFSEVYGYTFMSEDDLKVLAMNSQDLLEVANPVQPENKYLRKSLIPGLLKAVSKNPTFDQIQIFEVGHVFSDKQENTYLALVTAGKNAKKIIEQTIAKIGEVSGLVDTDFEIKELSREDVQRFKIKKPTTYVMEIDIDKVVKGMRDRGVAPTFSLAEKKIHYRPLSKYPSMTRDLAFIVDKDLDAALITETIYEISEQINRVELFDEFVSDKLGVGKKNVAYHLYLQDMNQTMTDSEAEAIVKKIIDEVVGKYSAEMRKF